MNDLARVIVVLASGPDGETEATGPGVVLEESFFLARRPCLNDAGLYDMLLERPDQRG